MPVHQAEPDISLYYEDFGTGSPMVFTSSGNASHSMWQGQVAHFARSHRTITYDWRGTGGSSKPSGGYSGEAATADLLALVRDVAGEPAVLVGHGMGAHVSLMASVQCPELVRGLVLANGAPWYTGTKDGVPGGMSEDFLAIYDDQAKSYADILAEVVEKWMFAEPPSAALTQATVMDGLTWPQFVADEYGRTMGDLDFRESLDSIACPTLVLHGRHDRKQRYDGARYLAERIRNASLVTLENSAHCGHVEESERWNRSVAEFLLRLP